MSEQEYNHYVPRTQIDESILTGCEVTARCGERFAAELRVGSSGKADAPGLEVCPRCERIAEIRERQEELRDECEALNARARALRAQWEAERERASECV